MMFENSKAIVKIKKILFQFVLHYIFNYIKSYRSTNSYEFITERELF